MYQLVSIIILSYRNISGIFESLDSIFSQSYNNIEIIISDDASPDFVDYEDRIRSYVSTNNRGNIRELIINAIPINGGTVKNLNSAICLSHGEYIKVLSAEDKLTHSDVISHYVDFMLSNNYDICFGKMRGETPNGKYVYELLSCESNYTLLKSYSVEETRNRLFARNFLPAPAWFIRKTLFTNLGLIPEDTRLIEDYSYWLYLTSQGIAFGYLDEITIDYKMSGESSAGVYGERFMEDMIIIYNKYIFPYDHRFGIAQPVYNALKRGGLNYYLSRAKWKKLSTLQKITARILYFPFYSYTTMLDWKTTLKNKLHKEIG